MTPRRTDTDGFFRIGDAARVKVRRRTGTRLLPTHRGPGCQSATVLSPVSTCQRPALPVSFAASARLRTNFGTRDQVEAHLGHVGVVHLPSLKAKLHWRDAN